MVNCMMIGCPNRQGRRSPGVRYFGIPSVITNQCNKTKELSLRRRAEWIARINRREVCEFTVRRHMKVCGIHFAQGHPSSLFDSKNQDWAPSCNLGYENSYQHGIDSAKPVEVPPFPFSSEDQNIPQHLPKSAENLVQEEPSTEDSNIFNSNEQLSLCDSSLKDNKSLVIKQECEIDPLNVNVKSEVLVASIEFDWESGVFEEPNVALSENASVQVRLCCVELDALKSERRKLIKELDHIKNCLPETGNKTESCDEVAPEKHLIVQVLQKKVKKMEETALSYMETCNRLESRISSLTFSEDSLRQDNSTIEYYTGLPSHKVLMLVFHLVSENIVDSEQYEFSNFQQYFMVLMWLKHGFEEQDLAHRFGVSLETVRKVLVKWIIPMSASLEKFITWPDRDSLRRNTPLCFQENLWTKPVAIIVDCFEVSTKPNKNQITVKFLVGNTPHGSILFISDAWSGSTSNQDIIENCGILDKLLPDDIILASHGFTNSVSTGIIGAKLASPDEVDDGEPLLSFDNVSLNRKVSAIQSHVERVIGLVRRKYKILGGTLPVEFITSNIGDEVAFIGHVARLCCALTNKCSTIDPL